GALLPHLFTLSAEPRSPMSPSVRGLPTGLSASHQDVASARWYFFCATFLRVTPTGRYPAHCPAEFGLSSRLRPLRGLRRTIVWLTATKSFYYPSVSCEIWYCSSFLYKLLRGVSITSAVFEIFHPFSRSLLTRYARSDTSLNSRSVPAFTGSLSPDAFTVA